MSSRFLILLFICYNIFPCSTFSLKKDSSCFVGKNYDWDIESGRIYINKKNVQKVAFQVTNPVSWTSKYGSITFNQYGQDFPIGGMNEKGLVIEALWLFETDYPPNNKTNPNIDNVQWIQYHLDNSADINDVIKNDSALEISPTSGVPIHCFVSDKNGNSLIFESVNGVIHHYEANQSKYPILTNDTYDRSVKMINRCKLFGGSSEVSIDKGSISRFIQIGAALKKYSTDKTSPIDYSFDILYNVSVGDYTKWSIVYDLENLTVHYKTNSSDKIKIIKLKEFDFNCSGDTKSIDIINDNKGDISNLFISTPIELNKKMVTESFSKTSFFKDIDPEFVKGIYNYPLEFKCK